MKNSRRRKRGEERRGEEKKGRRGGSFKKAELLLPKSRVVFLVFGGGRGD
jgi:hypothetical protein